MSTAIIIVDDEEDLRENLQDLLEFQDYQVHAFSSAEALLEQVDSIQADLALLDIQLPGMNGIELLVELKKRSPTLPIAMVSASSVKSVWDEASGYGAETTILKPYSNEELLKTIQTILAKSEG